MGLFDFLKKSTVSAKIEKPLTTVPSVPVAEGKYYQPNEYYTAKSYEGTICERTVVTFEERKKTSVPSENGLYVAEILLLEYCSQGKYPHPTNGYPGFWWFEYGIRDVGAALESLRKRGFIEFGSAQDALKGLTVIQLKELLQKKRLSTTGKKAELIEKTAQAFSEEELEAVGVEKKYVLTAKGFDELEKNAYVPYMHKHPNKTTEGDIPSREFNVWSINRLLGMRNTPDWKSVVDAQERLLSSETEKENKKNMEWVKEYDPSGYKVIRTQDQQIKAVQKRAEEYYETKDIKSYIEFWENLWETGGLKFEGSGWHFVLPDLYIKTKEYAKARKFLDYLKKKKPCYINKADKYIQRIEKLEERERKKAGNI